MERHLVIRAHPASNANPIYKQPTGTVLTPRPSGSICDTMQTTAPGPQATPNRSSAAMSRSASPEGDADFLISTTDRRSLFRSYFIETHANPHG